MDVIDITLRHLDLRTLRLGADDPTFAGASTTLEDAEEAEEPEPDRELDLATSAEYTTAWQLTAEV